MAGNSMLNATSQQKVIYKTYLLLNQKYATVITTAPIATNGREAARPMQAPTHHEPSAKFPLLQSPACSSGLLDAVSSGIPAMTYRLAHCTLTQSQAQSGRQR